MLLKETSYSRAGLLGNPSDGFYGKTIAFAIADFGVEVLVVAVHPGPVVTLFELQLSPGTKASKIVGLSKDLARALSVISVRVV